jgi:hypothetical protein
MNLIVNRPTKQHVIYVAHGSESYAQEAAYSILSLWRYASAPRFQIHVLTDLEQSFRRLLPGDTSVNYLSFSAEQRATWLGTDGYIHRIKPLAIQWVAQQVGSAHDQFLFLDTDTVATQDIQTIFDWVAQGQTVLNECEGTVQSLRHNTRSHKKIFEFAKQRSVLINGVPQPIDVQTRLWNSGVIGFSGELMPLYSEAVQWIDQVYPQLPIHTVEQVAFSATLHAHQLSLRDSGDTILHYHVFKEFRDDLAAFFIRVQGMNLQERLAHWHWIDPALRIQPKLRFNAQAKWKRQIQKRLGRSWKPLPYPWLV